MTTMTRCDFTYIWYKPFTTSIQKIPSLTGGGPERMGLRPPHWVPLLKSYGSSILSTSLGSKT